MKYNIFFLLVFISCNIDSDNNPIINQHNDYPDCSSQICLSLNGNDLLYSTTAEISGFQFDHNGCIADAAGGDASENGFSITFSDTRILAFSFSGSVIPIGSGVLLNLSGSIISNCISNFIFSGPGGIALSTEFID